MNASFLRTSVLLFLSIPGIAAAQTRGETRIYNTHVNTTNFEGAGAHFKAIGDLDGDGTEDFLSRHEANWLAPQTGVSVVSGASGNVLFFLQGSNPDDFGFAYAGGVDLNADGTPDILIGAPGTDIPGLMFGGGTVFAYSGVDGSLLFNLDGTISNGNFGCALEVFDDIDGDGTRDFAVGSSSASHFGGQFDHIGAVYVYSGATQTLRYRLDGAAVLQRFGSFLTGLGDLDGDGMPEMAIGNSSTGTVPPQVQVVACHSGVPLFATDFSDLFEVLVGVGDLDADGKQDFLAGFPEDGTIGTGTGKVSVHSGADGSLLGEFFGQALDGLFGHAAAAAGDVDHDGHGDLLIGAPEENDAGALECGVVYLYSGRTGEQLDRMPGSSNWEHFGSAVLHLAGTVRPVLLVGAKGESANAGAISYAGFHAFLRPSSRSLSVATGGHIDFEIDFPDTVGRDDYGLLMSPASGSMVVQGIGFQLGASPLLFLTKNAVYPFATHQGLSGQLTAGGDASGSLTVAPGELRPAYAGHTLWVAAMAMDRTFDLLYEASVAIPIEILP